MIRSCFKCANYIVREGRIGYCKIFDDIVYARSVNQLCGPTAKSFVISSTIGDNKPLLLGTTDGAKNTKKN